jgi:hypothetical protein
MKQIKQFVLIVIIYLNGVSAFPQQNIKYHKYFFEDFSRPHLKNFEGNKGGNGADFLWKSGVRLPTEKNTKVLLLRINPEGEPGAGRGPEISSKYFTHFGTYAARLKIPDVKKIQPDVGAVVGYFTYHMDSVQGLSEIDFEWLLADPGIIYIGTWTGQHGDLKRIGRIIDIAKGRIYNTSYRERRSGLSRLLTGVQSQPDSIAPIESYNATSQFNIYGFDWYPDRIRWWMIHPVSTDTVVLWDYRGSQEGIPQNCTHYRMNFWHTNNWPVETNPNSIEKPVYPFETEIDWMSYKPVKHSSQPSLKAKIH